MNGILILLAILLVVIFYLISVYNTFATLQVRIKEAWSQIDVQLKRRADLIPNLVESVKGYMTHESAAISKVTEAREALLGAGSPEEKATADNALTGALKSVFALAENYPDLKAQEGFVNLQSELSDTEDKVAYSRQFYNSVVRQMNEKLASLPAGAIGKIMGFTEKEFFEASESERQAVKVDFSQQQTQQ